MDELLDLLVPLLLLDALQPQQPQQQQQQPAHVPPPAPLMPQGVGTTPLLPGYMPRARPTVRPAPVVEGRSVPDRRARPQPGRRQIEPWRHGLAAALGPLGGLAYIGT